MKFFALSETTLNESSLKLYLPIVTLAIVSRSVSPINGDSPDNLLNKKLHKNNFIFLSDRA